MTTKPKKKFELDGWGDDDAADAAATSLSLTAARVEQERQSITEQALAERITAAVDAARPGLDKIPDPVEPAGDGDLTGDEKTRLDACIAGVELLSTAYWVAGKSLDTMAQGRLFRNLTHKLEPDRSYRTIDEWAWNEHGIAVSRCLKLRDSWQLGEVLAARGYKAPEGQIRPLIPFLKQHGLKAAVGVYEMVVHAVGRGKITADRLREALELLPGNLDLSDHDDPAVIAQVLHSTLDGSEPPEPKPSNVLPASLKRDVDRRAVALADRLKRGRLARTEVLTHLLAAFTDEQDPRVFDVVYERMKTSGS